MKSCEVMVASHQKDPSVCLCKEDLAAREFHELLKSFSNQKAYTTGKMQNDYLDETDLGLQINMVESHLNCQGNYNTYVSSVLQTITPIVMHKYPVTLKRKLKTLPVQTQKKKTLILDLDETLIHSDFDEIFEEHDQILHFTHDGEAIEIPVILRPGVIDFLSKISEHFEVIVFTASHKEYADAILNYLDPSNTIFAYRLYREDCIVLNNRIYLKDLRIFQNRSLADIVIVDNSLYSFCKHLSNGVLINSFYNDKEDRELSNLYNYLMLYILNSSDVRDVNEEFFNFTYIMEVYSQNSQN